MTESKLCPHYDSETHVCREDGTAVCPNPTVAFCETRLEAHIRKGGSLMTEKIDRKKRITIQIGKQEFDFKPTDMTEEQAHDILEEWLLEDDYW